MKKNYDIYILSIISITVFIAYCLNILKSNDMYGAVLFVIATYYIIYVLILMTRKNFSLRRAFYIFILAVINMFLFIIYYYSLFNNTMELIMNS